MVLLPLAIAASAAAGAYGAHKANKTAKKSLRQGASYNKYVKKGFRQATRDRRKNIAANKVYQKDIKKFLGKYGSEKYIKNPALTKKQQSLLNKTIERADKKLEKRTHHVPKLHKLEGNKTFKVGEKAARELVSGREFDRGANNKQARAGLKELLSGKEQRKALKPGQEALRGLLSGEALTKHPLYQQGQSALQEQLGGSPQDYENYKAPLMREFQRDIVPQIAERFAGQGANSGIQAQLGEAGADLGERLAALRSGIRERAIERGLAYAQAPGIMQQNALGAGLAYANAPSEQLNIGLGRNLEYNQARAGQRQNALQAALQYGTAPGEVQQQRINNAVNQNNDQFNQGYNLTNRALSTSPYNATFRAATPPPHPQQPATFNPGNYTPYQNPPSALSTFASSAASGLGQGIGQYGASRLGNYLSSNPSSGDAQGMAGSFAPTSAAGVRGAFGGMNQLGGFGAPKAT